MQNASRPSPTHLLLLPPRVHAKDDANGEAAMHTAAVQGHVEALRTLKELGCDVNAKGDANGATAMHIAAGQGHVEAQEMQRRRSMPADGDDDAGDVGEGEGGGEGEQGGAEAFLAFAALS